MYLRSCYSPSLLEEWNKKKLLKKAKKVTPACVSSVSSPKKLSKLITNKAPEIYLSFAIVIIG